jgi:hypothetical protein
LPLLATGSVRPAPDGPERGGGGPGRAAAMGASCQLAAPSPLTALLGMHGRVTPAATQSHPVATLCKAMQGNARQCKAMQGNARKPPPGYLATSRLPWPRDSRSLVARLPIVCAKSRPANCRGMLIARRGAGAEAPMGRPRCEGIEHRGLLDAIVVVMEAAWSAGLATLSPPGSVGLQVLRWPRS